MKNLLTASLLLASTSLCAQNQLVSVSDFLNQKKVNTENIQLLPQDALRAQFAKQLNVLPMATPANKPQATAAGSLGRAYLVAVECVPAMWDVSVNVQGNQAVFSNMFPYRNIADVKGTVDGNTITIAKDQRILDLQVGQTPVDGLLAEMNMQTGTMSDIKLTVQDGRYVHQPSSELGYIVIYAKYNGQNALLEGFVDYSVSDLQNLYPDYFSMPAVWQYCLSPDGMGLQNSVGAMPAGSQITWLSYVSGLQGFNYEIDWAYKADDTAQTPQVVENSALVMDIDAAYQVYTKPVVTAKCGGYTNTYGDASAAIMVDAGSALDTDQGPIDLGLSLADIKNNLTFGNIFGDFKYGAGGTAYTQQGQAVDVKSVISLYQGVPSVRFSSLGMVVSLSDISVGKDLQVDINEVVKNPDGNGLSIGRVIASSTITITPGQNFSALDQAGTWGVLTVDNFEAQNGDFTEPVETVASGTDFAVTIHDVKGSGIGLGFEATPDYACSIIGMPETAYVVGVDDMIYSLGTYADLFISFYGATLSPTSIASTQVAEDGIVAVANGASFELSYPEAVNAVQVVNVAGQVVAEYSLDGTSATISAAGLTNGMYILKFNNGAAVKVMK